MWANLQFPVDLVKFTEEILDGKRHFLVPFLPREAVPSDNVCWFIPFPFLCKKRVNSNKIRNIQLLIIIIFYCLLICNLSQIALRYGHEKSPWKKTKKPLKSILFISWIKIQEMSKRLCNLIRGKLRWS